MVYKKYVLKKGKKHGPYYYHSYRDGNKVKKVYIGGKKEYSEWLNKRKKQNIKKSRTTFNFSFLNPEKLTFSGCQKLKQLNLKPSFLHKKNTAYILIAIIFLLIISFSLINYSITGKASLDIQDSYIAGDILSGQLKLGLKKGELLPVDSKLIVEQNNQTVEFQLSQFVNANSNGAFYVENVDIEGEGQGYGFAGNKVSYPSVFFELRIYEESRENITEEVINVSEIRNETEVVSGGVESIEESEASNETEEAINETEIEVGNETVVEEPESEAENETEIPAEEPVESEEVAEEEPEVEEPIAIEEPVEEAIEEPTEEAIEEPAEEAIEEPIEPAGSPITGGVIEETDYTIEGSCSVKESFTYNLEESQTAGIIKNSVEVEIEKNGKLKKEKIDEEEVTLQISDNKLEVSTNYSIILEEGFGEEFLGEEIEYLEIDLTSLGVEAEEGELKISLVYNETNILEISKDISVVQPENLTINETNLTETNLSALNITTKQYKAVIGQPVKWVKHVEIENTDGLGELKLEIPKDSENIIIKTGEEARKSLQDAEDYEIEVKGRDKEDIKRSITGEVSLETGNKGILTRLWEKLTITGRVIQEEEIEENIVNTSNSKVVDLTEIVKGENELSIEYYTEAPESEEQELNLGKRVIISADDELGYTEVLAYSLLENKISINDTDKIKLSWIRDEDSAVTKLSEKTVWVQENESQEILGLNGSEIENITEVEENLTGVENITEEIIEEIENITEETIELNITNEAIEEPENITEEIVEVENVSEALESEEIINETIETIEYNSLLTGEVTLEESGESENITEEVIGEIESETGNETPVSEGKFLTYTSVAISPVRGGRFEVNFTAYDLDGDDMIDYVEWDVPHLSVQTYEIIYITAAEHLDENKTFINDIYPAVFQQDNIWSEVIYNNEYVRVTFEENLTNENDITIYARAFNWSNESFAEIEVYKKNGTEILAKFENISEEELHKIYLTNLSNESQDVFDLKVLGEVEFDYIVDPAINAEVGSLLYDTRTGLESTYVAANNTYDSWDREIHIGQVGEADWCWDESQYTDSGDVACYDLCYDNPDCCAYYEYDCYWAGSYCDGDMLCSYFDTEQALCEGYGCTYGFYEINRSTFRFNASAVPDDNTVTQVLFGMRLAVDGSDTNFDVEIWDSPGITYGHPGAVYDADWKNTGSISVGTWYNSSPLNTAWVNITGGYTTYIVKSSRDTSDTVPTGDEYIKIYEVSNDYPVLHVTYTSDSTPPAITIVTPENFTTFGASSVTVNVTLDETGTQCKLSINGDTNATMQGSATSFGYTNTSIGNGEHSFMVACNDSFNNWGASANPKFIIDTTSPSLSHANPTPADDHYQSNADIYVNASASDTGTNVSSFIDFDRSLVAWYRMDDLTAASSAADYHGIYNGTTADNAAQTPDGFLGKGFEFDGANDYIQSPNTPITNAGGTVTAWFKRLGNGDAPSIEIVVESFVSPTRYYFGTNATNDVVCRLGSDAWKIIGTSTNGVWYHFAMTWDGDSYSCYLNGVQKVADDSSTFSASPDSWGIGSQAASADFNGTIDDVIMFNRSLSAAEIAALYANQSSNYAQNNFTGQAVGAHSFTSYTQDRGANVDSESRTVTIDQTNPGLTLNAPEDNAVRGEDVTFEATATDGVSNVSTVIDLDGSLVTWLRMDDLNSSGDPYDYFGRYNGSRKGSAVQTGDGYLGNGFETDGASDYIDVGSLPVGSAWTISSWFKYPLTSTSSWNTLIRGTSFHHIIVQRSNMHIGVYVSAFRDSGFDVSTLSNGWHQVTAVGSGGNTLFYIDGDYKGTVTGYQPVDNLVAIGNYQGGSQQFGTIDDVLIFNRTLSAGEIDALYANASTKYLDADVSSLDTGTHTWTAYSQDRSANLNTSATRSFYVDASNPGLEFKSPTPSDGSTQGNDDIYVNASASDSQTNVSSFVEFDNDLLLWLRLDGSGIDNSSYEWGNTDNSVSFTDAGKLGKAATGFSAANYIAINSGLDFSNSMTLSFWMNVTNCASPSRQNPVGKAYYGDGTFTLETNCYINFYSGQGTDPTEYTADTSGSAAVVGVWEHWTLVRNNTARTTQWYKNGAVDGAALVYAAGEDPVYVAETFNVGDEYVNALNGAVDDVLIFNRSFSDEEVYGLYANQTTNYAENNFTGLDAGTHSFIAYTQDYGGNVNSSSRSVTIDDCYLYKNIVLTENLDCTTNLTVLDGVTVDTDGYNISVASHAVINGTLNLNASTVLNFTSTDGFYTYCAGNLNSMGDSSNGVLITGDSGWDLSQTPINITSNYTIFEYYAGFYSTSPRISMENTIFREGAGEYAVQFESGEIVMFDNVWVNTSGASVGFRISGDAYPSNNIINNLTLVDSGDSLEIVNDSIEFTNSTFGAVQLVQDDFASVVSVDHTDIANNYSIWPGNGTLSKSELTNDFGTGDHVSIFKDSDGDNIRFYFDEDAALYQLHVFNYCCTYADYILYFSEGIQVVFDDTSSAGFRSYDSGYGSTRITMYINGTLNNWINFTSAGGVSPSNHWNGPNGNWYTAGQLNYVLVQGHVSWAHSPGGLSVNNAIFEGGNSAWGALFLRDRTNYAESNVIIRDSATGLRIFRRQYLTNFTIENIAGWHISADYTTNEVIQFVNSSFDESQVTFGNSDNTSVISKNHNNSGRYLIFPKTTAGENYIYKSWITNFDFESIDNVTVKQSYFIIDQDAYSEGFNVTANADVTVNNGADLYCDRLDLYGNISFGNGELSKDNNDYCDVNFNEGNYEFSSTTISYGNNTGDTAILAYDATDGGNNIPVGMWIFDTPTISVNSPVDNATYNASVLMNVSTSIEGGGFIVPDLDGSLVSWWRMDNMNASSDPTDYFGINNGTNVGAAQTATGYAGKGWEFDGAGVEISTNFNTQTELTGDFTWSLWVKSDGGLNDYFIGSDSGGGDRLYLRSGGADATQLVVGLSSWNDGWAGNLPNGKWVHVAMVLDGTTGRVYQNGKLVDTQSSITVDIPNKNLYIGDTENAGGFDGKVDEVIIFNRSLSAEEVLALYNATNMEYLEEDLASGSHTYEAYISDRIANVTNSDLNTFTVDAAFPGIEFKSPTPDSASFQSNTDIYVNVSATDSETNVSSFIDFDGSLVSWWRMDDINSSGDPTDYTGRNNGSREDDAAQTDIGRLGKSFTFDGTTDNIDCGSDISFDASDNYTLVAWYKGTSTSAAIVSRMDCGADCQGFDMWIDTDGTAAMHLINDWNEDALKMISDGTVNDNVWHHVAVTYKGSSAPSGVNIYVDGINTTLSISNNNLLSEDTTPSVPLRIGSRSTGAAPSSNVAGLIDDVMIFNRSLSADEIYGLYANQTSRYVENNFTGLAEGNHTFKAYTQDYGGNLNSTEKRSVVIDYSDPTITLLNPPNMTISNDTTINFTANVSDWGSGISNITLWIYNQTGLYNSTIVEYAAGTFNVIVGIPVVLVEGIYNWFFEVWDLAANVELSSDTVGNRTLTVDVTYPLIDFVSPSPADGSSTGATAVYVNASADGSAGIETNISTFIDFDNSLVGWWRMDDTNGEVGEEDLTVYDRSNYGNDGTAVADAVQTYAGKLGKGFEFDGDGDYVNTGTTPLSGTGMINFSFSVWIKLIDYTYNYNGVLTKENLGSESSGSFIFRLHNASGAYRFKVFNSTSSVQINTVTQDNLNQWYHYAGVVNNTGVSIYRDGVFVASGSLMGGMNLSSELFLIGSLTSVYPFNGTIDDVMIFNRSLSVDEIHGLYANQSSNYAEANFTGLDETSYSYTAYTQDSAGNVNSSSRGITIDQTDPTLTLTAPENNSNFNASTVGFNVTGSDSVSNVSVFVDLDNSLVGWWRMDDINGSGDPSDYKGENNGSRKDGAAQTDVGYLGKGFEFDGDGDYINTSLSNSIINNNDTWTISMWFNAHTIDTTTRRWLTFYNNAGSSVLYIYGWDTLSPDTLYLQASNSTGSFQSTIKEDLDLNTWNLVSITHNGSTFQQYLNGVLSNTTISDFKGVGSYHAIIGNHHNGAQGFNGTLDDVMIFNRSLSAAEIRGLYANQTANYLETDISSIVDGEHLWKAYSQDRAANIQTSSTYEFLTDTVFPGIEFKSPTPDDEDSHGGDIYVNVSVSDSQTNLSTFIDWDSSLVGWWRMDDINSSGDVVDYNGNYNGTWSSNTTRSDGSDFGDSGQTDAGYLGKGWMFDGEGDYVDTGNKFDGSNITVCAWVETKFNYDTGDSPTIVGDLQGSGPYDGWKLFYNSAYDGWIFMIGHESDYIYAYSPSFTNNVDMNRWQQVCAVANETYAWVYINGSEVGTDAIDGGTYRASSNDVRIGHTINAWGMFYFNGTIDDVIIFNRTLTAEEIAGLYANTSSKYVENNFTGLAVRNYAFTAYTQDYGGNVNVTETRTISGNSVPVTSTPQISPLFPNIDNDVNCSFTVTDDDGGDTLTANVTWYNESITYYRTVLTMDNGVSNSTILESENTTVGETWICGVTPYDAKQWGIEKNSSGAMITDTPNLTFMYPTPDNNTETANTSIEINVSIYEESLDTIKWNWNGTNYTLFNDSTVLFMNFENSSDLGENDTHVFDVSASQNNGSFSSNPDADSGPTASGKYGGAFMFDGDSDWILLPNVIDFGTEDFSIAFWGKFSEDISSWGGIFSNKDDYNSNFVRILLTADGQTYPGQIRFYTEEESEVNNNFGMDCVTTMQVNDSTWRHFVFVRYGDVGKIFVNGGLDTTGSVEDGDLGTGDYFWIGDNGADSNNLNGTLDDAIIYNRALSAGEIYQLYASSLYRYNTTNWNLYVNQSKNATAGLEDGTYTYYAYAGDTSDNYNYSEERSVTIDLTGPVITIVAPPNNAVFDVDYVTVNVTLDETGSWCGLSVDGNAFSTMQGSGTSFGFKETSIGEGEHDFFVRCNDTYNHITNTALYYFTIDTGFPLVSFANPSVNDSAIQSNTDVYVNVSSSDSETNVSTFIDWDSSLVGWWRMDDVNSSGDVVEYFGRMNGSRRGDESQIDAGKLGKGFEFDGASDWIFIPPDESTYAYNYTISAWVYPIATPDSNYAILRSGNGDGYVSGFSLYQTSGNALAMRWGDGSSNDGAITSSAVSLNNWYNFVGTFNGTTMVIYVNGIKNNSDASVDFDYGSSASMRIGVSNGLVSWNGTIDDVMIFNRSLSADEVYGLYANTTSKYVGVNLTELVDGNYTFKAYVQDYGGNVNSTEEREMTVNQLPTVTLLGPDDDNITNNRTPTFTWSGNDPGGGPDALTYEINITCWDDGSIITVGSEFEDVGTDTSYTPSDYLKCLDDNGQYYNWTVRAYDGINYSAWATPRNLSIQSVITTNMIVDYVNFGLMDVSDYDNTTDDDPAPLILENLGNAEINISVNFTDIFDSESNPSSYYQYKVINTSAGCFVPFASKTSWTNAPSITANAVNRLNFTAGYQTGCSNVSIDIHVGVPVSEPPGNKTSLATFTSSLGEDKLV